MTKTYQIRRPELIHRDAHFRNKWLSAIVLFIIISSCLFWVLSEKQADWLQLFSNNDSSTEFRLLVVLYSFISILAIMLFTAGLQLILTARKSLQCGYFPAANTRVLRDTWIIRGNRARVFSFLLMITGLLFFIAGGYLPLFFHNLLLQLHAPVG